MAFGQRSSPILSLVVLAPLIGEFLVGDFPVGQIYLICFVLPLYGFGALLIREVARRTGRGWPAMVSLAYVYGVLEKVLSINRSTIPIS